MRPLQKSIIAELEVLPEIDPDAEIRRRVDFLTGYLAAFGLSHPLAKKIGAWPSVFAVTGAFGAATCAVTSRTAATSSAGA